MNEQGRRVSFDLDTIFRMGNQGVDFLLSMFKPTMGFIKTVSEESWLGLALVFLIFFTLFLIRMGARSGQGIGVYAASLDYVGSRGLIACACLLGFILAEWLATPPLALLLTALGNTLFGGEPGLFQLAELVLHGGEARSALWGDVAAFYRAGHSIVPLGWRAAGLVAVAFGSMWLVGKAGSRVADRR